MVNTHLCVVPNLHFVQNITGYYNTFTDTVIDPNRGYMDMKLLDSWQLKEENEYRIYSQIPQQ